MTDMSQTIRSSDVASLVGREVEPSPWFEITQDRINQFADATKDHQFIHVDEAQAARTPFGRTIAHGYLTLSLIPFLTAEKAPVFEDLVMGINYGSDKVRFLQPVPVGSRIRARQKYLEASEKNPGQWLIKSLVTIEIEEVPKPALIAETLAVFVFK
jgi:acyl dehydratase